MPELQQLLAAAANHCRAARRVDGRLLQRRTAALLMDYTRLSNDAGDTMATQSERTVGPGHAEPGHAERKSAVEARQGVISGRVFLVLVTSLILAIAALVVGYWYAH